MIILGSGESVLYFIGNVINETAIEWDVPDYTFSFGQITLALIPFFNIVLCAQKFTKAKRNGKGVEKDPDNDELKYETEMAIDSFLDVRKVLSIIHTLASVGLIIILSVLFVIEINEKNTSEEDKRDFVLIVVFGAIRLVVLLFLAFNINTNDIHYRKKLLRRYSIDENSYSEI